MIMYEFYRRVPFPDEDCLLGILPEKRKRKERITYTSIMKLAKKLSPEDVLKGQVYFIRVVTDDQKEANEISLATLDGYSRN